MAARRISWLLSIAAACLMAVSSAAGIYWPDVYVRETPSWAAQGVGQDIVNLFVVAPALVLCLYFAKSGSIRAWLICLGLLLYVTYSYVLYAFFVHFNRLFLVYVAVLGVAFWAAAGVLSGLNLDLVGRACDRKQRYLPQAAYLAISGLLFGGLWLSDIVPAAVSGTPPRGLTDVGLPVNPVHVLDLAFVLPAMIATSWLLWIRHPLGLLFTVPLLTFAATMGAAIIAMSVVMSARGLAQSSGIVLVFVVLVVLALDLTYLFLRRTAALSTEGRC
jgi:hypothetical protein